MVKLNIPGTPQGKARPRVVRGHAFTPERTRVCEDEIRLAFKRAAVSRHWNIPLIRRPDQIEVTITAFMPIPRSWTKAKQAAALDGQHPHTSRPDADNLAKTVLDALNRLAWEDDSQIVRLIVEKRFHTRKVAPGFLIFIYSEKKELS